MNIYISDRNGNILKTAASDLPNNQLLINDLLTDDLQSGIKTLELELEATKEIRECAVCGNYILADSSLYTIVSSELDVSNRVNTIYCEDIGLDFRNRVCGAIAASSKTFEQWVISTIGTEAASGWNYNFNIKNTTKKLEYTAEDNAQSRLQDILANYNAEMYFTYEIDAKFKWISRTINFVQKRGSKDIHKFYKNKEIENIVKKENVEDLATVWRIQGLNKMKDYKTVDKTYPITDTRLHTYTVSGNDITCVEAKNKWKSKLDKDGIILANKTTEYKTAASAINYAIREMEKIVEPKISYEVSMLKIPREVEVGDYVNILDAEDNILVSARIQVLRKSECSKTCEIELGDFKELESKMADITFTDFNIYTISITSSNGVVGTDSLSTVLNVIVNYNGNPITTAAELPEGRLVWFENGVEINDSRISNGGFTLTITNLTANTNYQVKLMEV